MTLCGPGPGEDIPRLLFSDLCGMAGHGFPNAGRVRVSERGGVSECSKKLELSEITNPDCSCKIQTYRDRDRSWDWLVLSLLLSLHHGTLHVGGCMGDVLTEEV